MSIEAEEFKESIRQSLRDKDSYFSWVRDSALTERAFWIGVAIGTKPFSEKIYESSLREALFETYFIRAADNPYNYCSSKKKVDELKGIVKGGGLSESFMDGIHSLEDRVSGLNKIWVKTREEFIHCLRALERNLVEVNDGSPSEDSQGVTHSRTGKWVNRDQAHAVEKTLEDLSSVLEKLESIALPVNTFDRVHYRGPGSWEE